MKTGYKTSEFWLGLIFAVGVYLNTELGWNVPWEMIVTLGGVTVAYIASRTSLKLPK